MQMEVRRPVSSRVNVGRMERGISLISGMALLAYTLSRRPRLGVPIALHAGYMLYRGVTGHCVFYQMLGINRAEMDGHEGILVERSVTVNRPRAELYQMWRDFENLPRFMKHLESVNVEDRESGRSHWVAKGPIGASVEWDAEVINDVENQVIGWRSLPEADVVSAGSVTFNAAPEGRGTELRVKLQYQPPGGKIGAAFARLFGEEPSQQIREDLRRLRQLMETGGKPMMDAEEKNTARQHETAERF